VVIGIGHEQDFSVLDHVGWRAKTPTAAAQLLVQRVRESLQRLEEAWEQIRQLAEGTLVRAEQRLDDLSHRLLRATAGRLDLAERDLKRMAHSLPLAVWATLGRERERLAGSRGRLRRAVARVMKEARSKLLEVSQRVAPLAVTLIERERAALSHREGRLRALDPRRVVERGYAILRLPEGKAVVDPAQAPPGTRLVAEVRGGTLRLLSEGGERRGRCGEG